MEKRAQAFRDYMKNPVLKRENLNPKKWLKSDYSNSFTDFTLQQDTNEAGGYDSNEMCKYRL